MVKRIFFITLVVTALYAGAFAAWVWFGTAEHGSTGALLKTWSVIFFSGPALSLGFICWLLSVQFGTRKLATRRAAAAEHSTNLGIETILTRWQDFGATIMPLSNGRDRKRQGAHSEFAETQILLRKS